MTGEIEAAEDSARWRGCVALVTGANRGIGLAVARGLAERGLSVLLGSRDPARGEAAAEVLRTDGLSARALPLDLNDDDSVLGAAATVDREVGRLDVLVNNAAVKLEFHPSAPSHAPLDLVRATYETNVFGTIRVLQAMLPLLARSPSPRIVNVSSGLGSLTLATTEGTKYRDRPLLSYNTAKAALNSVTVQFANELRHTPFKVNAVDPGPTDTEMTRGTAERTAEQGAVAVLRMALLEDDGPTGCFFDEHGELPW